MTDALQDHFFILKALGITGLLVIILASTGLWRRAYRWFVPYEKQAHMGHVKWCYNIIFLLVALAILSNCVYAIRLKL